MSFMVKNAGIIPSVSSIAAGDLTKNRHVLTEILASTWSACTFDDDETGEAFTAEAIIANPPSFGHIHCAQKLQIPLHIMFTMPWSPTTAFPHPLVNVDYSKASIERVNMLSYSAIEMFVSIFTMKERFIIFTCFFFYRLGRVCVILSMTFVMKHWVYQHCIHVKQHL